MNPICGTPKHVVGCWELIELNRCFESPPSRSDSSETVERGGKSLDYAATTINGVTGLELDMSNISTLDNIYDEDQILRKYHQNIVDLFQLVTDSDHRLRILIWVKSNILCLVTSGDRCCVLAPSVELRRRNWKRNGAAYREAIQHYICGDPEGLKPEPSMNGHALAAKGFLSKQ